MTGKTTVVIVMLLASALAGCIASEAGDDADVKGPDPGGPARFDETTGGIEGHVTDSSVAPIVGAMVGILKSDVIQTEMIATTDAEGRFSLSLVPPGDHVLNVQALGYSSTAKRVTVNQGELTSVNIILSPLPVDEPYHRTIYQKVQLSGAMYKLTPQCMYTDIHNLAKTCGGIRLTAPGSEACDCEVHTNTDERMKDFNENWTTIVAELTWKPQTGVSGRGFSFDLNAPNITRNTGGSINQANPKTWTKTTGNAPIVHRVDKPTTLVEREIPESDWNNYVKDDCTAEGDTPNCDWFWRVFPAYCDLGQCESGPDYGVMLDGVGEVYFSYWIKEPAPVPWTALPDG